MHILPRWIEIKLRNWNNELAAFVTLYNKMLIETSLRHTEKIF